MKLHAFTTKLLASALAGAVALTSCTSATLIQSTPPGAKVYINDEFAGSTPYLYKDTKIVGSASQLRLEKEGYAAITTLLTRNEELDVGALIGGLFVWIPFLWVMKYKPTRTYELQPASGGNVSAPPRASQAPLKSKAERLRELKQILDEGIITQEEYEKEKKKILEGND